MLRLTTDAPLSYIEREAPFRPDTSRSTWCSAPTSRSPAIWAPPAANSPIARATIGWNGCGGLSIAYDWQDAIIRAAITLKLSNFEETGGIVAALTTSIPEAPGSGRTWDYRYCWLRDAYFVVKALNRFGATQDHGGFHLLHSRHRRRRPSLRPVYSVVPSDAMDETDRPDSQGLSAATGRSASAMPPPIRTQHDTYRQHHPRRHADVLRPEAAAARATKACFDLLETLGEQGGQARLRRPTPASGNFAAAARPYLFRGDVLGRLQPAWRPSPRISASPTAQPIGRDVAGRYPDALLEQAWNDKARLVHRGVRRSDDLDASVLLLPELGADRAERPALRSDGRGHRTGACSRGSTSCAMPTKTISACPKPRS